MTEEVYSPKTGDRVACKIPTRKTLVKGEIQGTYYKEGDSRLRFIIYTDEYHAIMDVFREEIVKKIK